MGNRMGVSSAVIKKGCPYGRLFASFPTDFISVSQLSLYFCNKIGNCELVSQLPINLYNKSMNKQTEKYTKNYLRTEKV